MASYPTDIKTEGSRQSLTQTIEDLYNKIPAGGAFNAKDIETSGKHSSLSKAGNSSFQSAQWTPSGFKTKMGNLLTEFKSAALGFISRQGHSTQKYKP